MSVEKVDVSLLLDGVDGSTAKNVVPEPIEIQCGNPSKLFFTISSDDAVQFAIYSVDPTVKKTNPLQTIVSKKAAGQEKYTASAAGLLLEKGNYFVTVKLTGRSDESEYTIALDKTQQNIFYTQADDGWNSYLYDTKTKTVNAAVAHPEAPEAGLPVAIAGYHYVEIDAEDADNQLAGNQGFVGFGDAADYRQFTLTSAATLSFDVEATDAVKFTVYSLTASLDKKGNTVYTQKALQSSTAKLNKDTGNYEVTTAGLLLDNADPNTTYYLAMESTNAAKGGSATYTVEVNGSSRFFTLGDNGSNDWLYDAKTKEVNEAVFNGPAAVIDDTGAVVIDSTGLEFVGYGDAADYRQFTLTSAATLSFDVEATDAVKFTVYSLTASLDKKGNTVYTQKALQSSTAKLDKETGSYKVTTAGLLLDNADPDTTYYLAVESTNAAKGGFAAYTVTANDGSVFYTKGDTSDDTWDGAGLFGDISDDPDAEIWLEDGWVGFGDTVDFNRFTMMEDMSVCFRIDANGPVKFTVYQFDGGKLKSLQSTTVKADVTATTKALALKAGGEYCFAVESTDAAKGGSADYTVTGGKYAAPLNVTINGNGLPWDGWMELEEAQIVTPVGSVGADKITFAGNCEIYVPGILDMKGGDDTVTVGATSKRSDSYAGGEVVFDTIEMGDGNDKLIWGANTGVYWTTVNLGNGNDTLQLAADGFSNGVWINYEWVNTLDFGDGNDLLELGSNSWFMGGSNGIYVDFGSGNDTMKMAAGSIVHSWHEDTYFHFGEGNDSLTIARGAGIMKVTYMDFGADNDTMTVDQGNDRCNFGSLDFGDGYDTLILNGRLNADEIIDVERVSGKGFVFLTGANNDYQAGDYAAFTAGGVAVVQGYAKNDAYGDNSRTYEYDCFSDPQSELADNVMSKARDLETEYESKYANFWLCGEETAAELAYGFTDEVDFIKLTVDRNMQGKTLSVGAFAHSGFSLEILNAAGNAVQGPDENPIVLYSGDHLDLADIATGTYYMKLSVASGGYACGSVAINPVA